MRTPNTEHKVHGGVQRLYTFDNGYEASVVRHPHSYGGDEGLWEAAVLLNGSVCYSTPITDDILGWLNEADVDDVLARIEELPRA
jgi:hypothetical protein